MTFHHGDRVRAIVENPSGHTRLPAYLRGRVGRVIRFLGTYRFPGELAVGKTDGVPRELYTVQFEASELWGVDAMPGATVTADLFETYLRKI